MTHKLVSSLIGTTAILLALCSPVIAADTAIAPEAGPIFDEARFGAYGAIDNTYSNDEKGFFVTGMLFFDPWDHDNAQGWQKLARPRVHVGADISTAGETNQAYAGFSWTFDLNERFFLEAGFGGSVNDGKLRFDGGRGPYLGCHALFHEYMAAGVNVNDNWRVVAQVEHSSHAGLCGDWNSGLTRAGVLVGYKF